MNAETEKILVEKFIKPSERERILKGLSNKATRKQAIEQFVNNIEYACGQGDELSKDEFLINIRMYIPIHEAMCYVLGDQNYDGYTIPFEQAFKHMFSQREAYVMVNHGPFGYTLIARGYILRWKQYEKFLEQTR